MKHCPKEDETGAIALRQIGQLGTVFRLLLSISRDTAGQPEPPLQHDSSTV